MTLRKIISLALTMAMLLTMMPFTVVAEDATDLTTNVTGLSGFGTAEDPFLINNLAELKWFRDKVDEQASDGSTQFAGKYFKLTADIDLAGINWNPIGSMTGDHCSFKGIFDGDNHTISNLTVEQAGNGLGLFAYTAGNAEIKNLTLNNVTVKSTDNSNNVGSVVGNAFANTKITNVHVTGNIDISGRGYIGGIVGHGFVVMDNVSVVGEGTIYSTFWCAGGILGYGGEGTTNITNATVEGTGKTGLTITSAAGGLGAIIGMAEDNKGTQPIAGANLSAKNVAIKTYVGAYGTAYSDYALGYLYGGNSTSILTGTNSVENVAFETSTGDTNPPVNDAVAKIGDAVYFTLAEAVAKAAYGDTVELLREVTENITIADDATVVIDLGGKTLNGYIAPCNPASLTVKNGSIKNADFNYSAIEVNAGTLEVENVNIDSERHAVRIDGAVTATINGGTYKVLVNNNLTAHAVNVSGAATVTIKDGTFYGPKGTPNGSAMGGSAVNAQAGSTVIIEGGNFSKGLNNTLSAKGTLTVYGGTYDQDVSAYCAEDYIAVKNADGTYTVATMPNAKVSVLAPLTLTAAEHEYIVWPSGDATVDRPLEVVMNFKTNDTLEAAQASAFGEFKCDFYLTVSGLEGDSIIANNCYLAGNYGTYGWIVIPADGLEIENEEEYPIVSNYDANLTYENICDYVKDFTAAIHIDSAILEANPNMKVTLALKMVNPNDETQVITIGEPAVYDVDALSGKTYDAKIGDTVELLRDITLTEAVAIKDNSVLAGITLNGNGHTIYDAVAETSTLVFGDTTGSYWATGVTIKNLTVEATSDNANPYCAIRLVGGTSSTLTNVNVVGNYAYGINFYGTHGATLENCHIASAFTNGQSANPLNLTNGTVITTLIANDGADMNPKIFIDGTSSITTLYADEHTAMIDANSMARIGAIYEADTEEPMVAEVNGVMFGSLAGAASVIATDGTDTTIKILTDIEVSETIEFAYGAGNVIFTADTPVTIKQTATSSFKFTQNQSNKIIVGENVTFETYDNSSNFNVYYGPSLEVNGTITGGANWGALYLFNGTHTVSQTGKIGTGRVQMGYTTLTVTGEVDTNYLLVEKSTFTADGATACANVIYDNNNGTQRWGASNFNIKNGSDVTTTSLTLSYADTKLTIDTSSTLKADTITGAGQIIIDAANYVSGSASPIIGNASTFTGTVTVINNNKVTAEIDDDGNIVLTEVAAPSADLIYAGYVGTSGEAGTASYRENIQVDLYNIYAEESLVVELWCGDTKLSTTTLRQTDRDDENVKLYPVEGSSTANIVVNGRLAGSWDTVWHVAPSTAYIPDTIKAYADGVLTDTWNGGFINDTELEEYKALTGVAKADDKTTYDGLVMLDPIVYYEPIITFDSKADLYRVALIAEMDGTLYTEWYKNKNICSFGFEVTVGDKTQTFKHSADPYGWVEIEGTRYDPSSEEVWAMLAEVLAFGTEYADKDITIQAYMVQANGSTVYSEPVNTKFVATR